MSLIPLTVWPARGRRRPDENVMRTAPFIDAPDAAIVLGPRQARPRRAALNRHRAPLCRNGRHTRRDAARLRVRRALG
ncbi:hypothetical protein, partial [Burkholderia pseudomallei]|uniref:hypothetical protein n=1 Tax=Burkholderia pseudomallei TaxID=28450 RepID=UPI00292EBC33